MWVYCDVQGHIGMYQNEVQLDPFIVPTVSVTSATVTWGEWSKENGAPLQYADLENRNTLTDRYDVVIKISF